jgi:predicted GH43/DUF377 family glycosyl hydrolase
VAYEQSRKIIPYNQCRKDVAPIKDQTKWPTGFFEFKTTETEAYFNCGLARNGGALWLLTRHWKKEAWNLWHSDIVTHELSNDFKVLSRIELQFPNDMGLEQYEDPRVIFFDNRYWVSYCIFRHHNLFQANQQFCAFNALWQPLQVWHVPYGRNGNQLGQGSGNEKNWTWFWHENSWHFVYSFQPHVVVRVNTPYDLLQFSTKMAKHPWIYGEVRGGTPPVRVGDEYISFFHSSLPWRGRQKRYYMGAYAFRAEGLPNKTFFRITRCTKTPLLSGSEHDPRLLCGPLVVFPCGALFDGTNWLVSMGINDEACGYILIDHKALNELLLPVL